MKKLIALVLSCIIMASIAIPALAADIFTLKYDMNGVTATPASIANVEKDQTATAEERTVKLAALPTAEGKTCTGWNTKADGTGSSYAAGADFEIKEDVTLYATWKTNTYKLSYSANNVEILSTSHIPETKEYDASNSASVALPLQSNSYVFECWNTKADGTGTSYEAGSSITMKENVTLYAVWTAVKNGYYLIRYNLNGAPGTAPASQENKQLADTVLAAAPAIAGYTFKEWNTKADGTGNAYAPGSKIFTGDHKIIDLYAIWTSKPDADTYIVSIYPVLDGKVSSTANTYTYKKGATLDLKAASVEGYKFNDFYSDKELTSKFALTTMPEKNIDVYAKYTKDENAVKTYKLSFVTNIKAKTFAAVSLKENDDIKLPTDVDVKDYYFAGFYSDKEMTKKFETAKMPAADTVVYAKYAIKLSVLKSILDSAGSSLISAAKESTAVKLTDEQFNTIIKAAGIKITYKINGKDYVVENVGSFADEIYDNIVLKVESKTVSSFSLTFLQNDKVMEGANIDEITGGYVYNDVDKKENDQTPVTPNNNTPGNNTPSDNTPSNNNNTPTNNSSNNNSNTSESEIPKTGSTITLAVVAAVCIVIAGCAIFFTARKKKDDDEEDLPVDPDEE